MLYDIGQSWPLLPFLLIRRIGSQHPLFAKYAVLQSQKSGNFYVK